jgi:Fn3 associated/CotH kinase protein/Secretion system C-terminal sorting domain
MNKLVYICCLLGLSFRAHAQNLQTINVNIANGNDDIEVSSTKRSTSVDLELGGFDFVKQYVALRFQHVSLPPNARVTNAYIQFTTKVGNSTTATVGIRCQQGNAQGYLAAENLLARPYVSNQMVWNSPAWFVTGESGANQRTPNLAAQLNEAIATNWQSGNSLGFILEGNAKTNDVLNARSFESNATHAGAPQLFVEYTTTTGGGNPNAVSMATLQKIFINEVAPKGTVGFPQDWVELYNGNDFAVPTDSIYITSKQTNPFKWRLKYLTIPARGFLRLIADKDTLAGINHVDFKLGTTADKAFLFKNVDGKAVELAAFEYPATAADEANITYGTATDGVLNPKIADLVKFVSGTPNASNATGKQYLRSTNNTPRGIIQIPATITLTAPAGAEIRYTTNLTQPSHINGIFYTQPIVINQTTILKIFTYSATGESNVETFTYINPVRGSELHFPNQVTPEGYINGLKQLPIISITTLPNGGAVDSKTQQICGFEYINKFGEAGNIGILGGVAGYGNDSYLYSEQKNLRVHFKSSYGFSNLDFPIFKKDDADTKAPVVKYDVLDLKIGQDGPNADGYCMLMSSHGLVSKTMRELGNTDVHTQYIHAFVNGKYHGVYTLKEKYDEHFGSDYYGGKKEQYDVIEGSWNNPAPQPESTLDNWKKMAAATAQPNFQEVKKYLNVSQFIDFMMLMMYFDNEWEYRAVADKAMVTTKFTFENHDTDGALTKTSDENEYAYDLKWTDPAQKVFNGPVGMFGNLVRNNNKEFKTLVRDRVYEAMQKQNGALTPARIQTKLTELKNVLYSAFNMELARFNQTFYNNNPYFDEEYNKNIAHLPTRHQYNLNQWLSKDLAHTLLPVTFSQPAGNVTRAVTVANPNNQGIVYYTTDGSDPMGNDGVISAVAKTYADSLNLKAGANTVVARVYWNGELGPKTKIIYTKAAGTLVLLNPIKTEVSDNQLFTISPNPVYDYADLDLTAVRGQSVTVMVYNNLGQPLLHQTIEQANGTHRFALNSLATGQYILTIQVEGQATIGRKLIINR